LSVNVNSFFILSGFFNDFAMSDVPNIEECQDGTSDISRLTGMLDVLKLLPRITRVTGFDSCFGYDTIIHIAPFFRNNPE